MPYVNIALDLFGLVITLIIFISCLNERLKGEIRSNGFLLLMLSIIVVLVGDAITWSAEGHPELALGSIIGSTVACCSAYLAIYIFMVYFMRTLYGNSKTARFIVAVFAILCIATIGILIANAVYGFAFGVNDEGHYVHTNEYWALALHLVFPMLAFFVVILMSIFDKSASNKDRVVYILYTVFPAIGVVIDYLLHECSLTYIGLVVSTVIIYTSVYLQKRKVIESQRMALMMSQINPHFMYNALSTMASLCDTSPSSAKNLIIEFSSYLRTNIDTLNTTDLIPFDQELGHVECYLKIEKARFLDRINIIYSIQCKNFSVPPLTVQPIVENAIKHGITKKPGGGTVRISTYATDDAYVIEVTDDGVGFDVDFKHDDGKTHVGIDNVRARLKDMCRGTLTIKSMANVGTRVTIEIPKKKGK